MILSLLVIAVLLDLSYSIESVKFITNNIHTPLSTHPCAQDDCGQGFLIPPRYDTQASIAIIGSGMSGLLTARKLAQFGYTNITIFEKDPHIGGYTQSYFLDGEYFDFQAHLIAPRFWGSHLHPETEELLNEVPFPFRAEFIQWRNSTDTVLPLCLMEIAAGLVDSQGSFNFSAVEQFIMDIIETHAHLTEAYWGQVGEGGPGSINLPGMDLSWEEFKTTFNPVGSCLHETLINSANMRRPGQSASFVIGANSLLQFILPATLAKMMAQFSEAYPQQWSKVLQLLPNSLRLSMIHTNCYAAYQGWNNWMLGLTNRLTERIPNFNILTNTPVKRLKGGATVEIEDFSGQIYNFDVAIITSRPRDTRQFVESPELQDLFSEQNCPTVWTRSVLIESEYPIKPSLPGDGLGFLILEPWATLTGTSSISSHNFYTGCNKQNSKKERWMCFSNSEGPEEITTTKAWSIGRNQLKEFGFGESKHLTERLSNWPVFPKASRDWYQQAGKLQGVDNIFFGGEIMSGATIESIIDYVYKAVPQWFAIVQKPEGI